MKCADIMRKNIECLTETDSVQKAAHVMAEAGIGFLPICDELNQVVGVVTDRDLTTRAMANKVVPERTLVTLVMSTPAITCLETADVRDAEELMAKERKSRLVITNAAGKLAGVINLADLVERAPGRQSLRTVRAVLWREALGPRGGATRDQPLLKDDPTAGSWPAPSEELEVHPSVFDAGHRYAGTKEFPG
jgi:CBS domain-containing protein